MQLITIGDLHGSAAWKRINPLKFDRMVFMGDYVDSDRLHAHIVIRSLEDTSDQ